MLSILNFGGSHSERSCTQTAMLEIFGTVEEMTGGKIGIKYVRQKYDTISN